MPWDSVLFAHPFKWSGLGNEALVAELGQGGGRVDRGGSAVTEGKAVRGGPPNQEQAEAGELPPTSAVSPQLAHFSLEKLRPPKGAGMSLRS